MKEERTRARFGNFCKRLKLLVTNTWYRHEKRRRYTWKKPGDTGRYQLDYILIKHRYRNSVKDSRAYPGADVDSDHNLVMAKIDLKLKKILKSVRKKMWCMNELEKQKENFQEKVERELTRHENDGLPNIEEDWRKLKEDNRSKRSIWLPNSKNCQETMNYE